MPSAPPNHTPRRSSYAAVVSGTTPTRAHGSSDVLQDFDFDSFLYHSNGPHSLDDRRTLGMTGSWATSSHGPPRYSRAYSELTNTYGYDGLGEHFFVPSYLRGSAYIQTLEAAYRAKVVAAREAAQSRHSSQPGSLSTSGSAANLNGPGKLAPSHRGMTFELIEKAAPVEAEGVQMLPSRWNVNDKYAGLEVLRDGYEVAFTGGKTTEYEAYSIRADHAMPMQSGIYYFEVKIVSRKVEDSIAIGFSTKDVPLSRPPGWEPNSWAYHGDDGHSYCCQSSGKSYGPTFTTDDVIGCGVNFHTGSAFFTKNGNHLGTAFREVRGKLFPSVGMMKPGEHVWVNFGQSPFVFDIDSMILKEKKAIEEQVAATSTANLAPPLDETSLIQSLVLQYLAHDGYVETAKAFSDEVRSEKEALNIGNKEEVKGFEFHDDGDASQRQEIRNAILDGDVDSALQLTEAHYPKVFEEDEDIYFRLQCRKFIEMIHRGAEIRSRATATRSNGHHSDYDAYDDMVNQDMELDHPHEHNGGFDKMDTDGGGGGASNGAVHDDYDRLLEETINFGKAISAEFAHDKRRATQRALQDAFALLAYEDPGNAPDVAHHLSLHKRVTLAEDLNSAILVSQGKSPSTALERLIKQTVVLAEDLAENGGPGSFVNVYDYMKPRPPSPNPF
ncbi:hypothetical protein V502_05953 [Pseudogymnoascus sp. VKM F-4520 (FW-2644)]|nr:hypothetical protein V502_05953 [Pseudogymnoascus sp. VKM F-4520 (FW-2644)]